MRQHHHTQTHSFKRKKKSALPKRIMLWLILVGLVISVMTYASGIPVLSRILGISEPIQVSQPNTDISTKLQTLPSTRIAIRSAEGGEETPLQEFTVEIAATQEAREKGLMQRVSLEPDHGMLFTFPFPEITSMWMKDTLMPLDMLFIRADGTIAFIAPNAVPESQEVIGFPEPVLAVLELAGGTCEKQGIRVGDKIIHAYFTPSEPKEEEVPSNAPDPMEPEGETSLSPMPFQVPVPLPGSGLTTPGDASEPPVSHEI